MLRQPAIYILTNKRNGTLYTGVTRLVYFELFNNMYEAISREKQLKAGSRKRKLRFIEDFNPHWKDLCSEILG